MAEVGYRQTTAARIRPGQTRGACWFCDWEGEWHAQDKEGVNRTAADAREHMKTDHPEAVEHWEDLL